jgi:hypothetical protein
MKYLWWMLVAHKVGLLHGYGNHCWRNFELLVVLFLSPSLRNRPRALSFFREYPGFFDYDPDRDGAPPARSTL